MTQVIDADVHQSWPSQQALLPYLSSAWKEYVTTPGAKGNTPVTVSERFNRPYEGRVQREDGARAAATVEDIRDSVLRENTDLAILTHSELRSINGLRNPHYALEVARAANEWTANEWLSRDRRLGGSVLIATAIPEQAAAEIRRAGQNPQMLQVLISGNSLGQAYGHPVYEPIYAAAAEMGLPVMIHAGATGGLNPPPAGGGLINYYAEYAAMANQQLMTHLASLLISGFLDKYPELRIILAGAGFGWVPALLWRLDVDYRGCRPEVPWMKRLPSEYFYERISVTTHPLDAAPSRDAFRELLDCFDSEDFLLYGSGYPDSDLDTPDAIRESLPVGSVGAVLSGNARRVYSRIDALFAEAQNLKTAPGGH